MGGTYDHGFMNSLGPDPMDIGSPNPVSAVETVNFSKIALVQNHIKQCSNERVLTDPQVPLLQGRT